LRHGPVWGTRARWGLSGRCRRRVLVSGRSRSGSRCRGRGSRCGGTLGLDVVGGLVPQVLLGLLLADLAADEHDPTDGCGDEGKTLEPAVFLS